MTPKSHFLDFLDLTLVQNWGPEPDHADFQGFYPEDGQNSQFSFKNPKTKLLSKGTPLLRSKIDFFERPGQYLKSLSAKNDPPLNGGLKMGGTPQVRVTLIQVMTFNDF